MLELNAKPIVAKTQLILKRFLNEYRLKPHLHVILIGNSEASLVYINRKIKAAAIVGIEVTLHQYPETVTVEQIEGLLAYLNASPTCHGILIQLPLPKTWATQKILSKIAPKKDVDGFTPLNRGYHLSGQPCFVPCTALGIIHLLRYYEIDLKGKHILVLGRSGVVGQPLAIEALHQNATVTIAHSQSGPIDKLIQSADIVVSATGHQGVYNWQSFLPHQVIVDVGIHRIEGKIAGDLGPKPNQAVFRAFTPVPGSVGPMTVNSLMVNVFKSYCLLEEQASIWQDMSDQLFTLSHSIN